VIGLGVFRIKSKLFGGLKIEIMSLDDHEEEDQDEPVFLKPKDIKRDDV
jgi:hypothetical protein